MKIHESAENYLETILILKGKLAQVRSIDIANELNFTKPSVSRAMKLLREDNYIVTDENGYIELTEAGMKIAGSMYERHMQISDFLISIGVDEDVALEDSCRIEHIISQQTFEKIRDYMKPKNQKQ